MEQVVVSASNRTPVVQIITWLCLVVSVLAFFTHAGIKMYTSRSLSAETILVFLSLLCSGAQSIAVSIQTTNGFGKRSDTLTASQIQTILKSEYAAMILFFFSVAFSKFAIIAFIHGLSPRKLDQHFNYGLGAFSAIWLVTSVFLSAFQCNPPHTWDRTSHKCINYLVWWDAVTVLNIISEVGIVALEIGLIIPLQMTRQRKASIISLFACRLLVAVAAGIQLLFFHKDHSSSQKDDLALGYWRSTICSQGVQCLAIVTTSLPYAKMMMDSLESGLIRVDELRRKGDHSTDGSGGGYKLLDISRSSQPAQQDGISRTKTYTVESVKAATKTRG